MSNALLLQLPEEPGGPGPTSCASDERDPLVGRTLVGRYALTGRLGRGSMGAVYRARQLVVEREVAVKILRGERVVDDLANARFAREARAHSLLVSPHTVRVLDFGRSDPEGLFLVMELLEGESLRRRLSRTGRLLPLVAVDVCQQALRSLGEAHAKGIVHRDLKPEHLFFSRVRGKTWDDEVLKILDFGIAKMLGEEGARFNALETREGRILGTPRYMSPEQAQGKPLDARSDLYSLGVILYEALTGLPPFPGEEGVVVMAAHVTRHAVPPSVACPEAGLTPELDAIVMRALAKDPDRRPPSAECMAMELSRLCETGGLRPSGVCAVGARSDMHLASGADSGPSGASLEQLPHAAKSPHAANVKGRRSEWGWVRPGIAVAMVGFGLLGGVIAAGRTSLGSSPAAATTSATRASSPPRSLPALHQKASPRAPSLVPEPDAVPIEALPQAGARGVLGVGRRRPNPRPAGSDVTPAPASPRPVREHANDLPAETPAPAGETVPAETARPQAFDYLE